MHLQASHVRRCLALLVTFLGLLALTVNPASARELCSENAALGLIDGDGDGLVSRGEIQALIDSAGDVEGVDQLQQLLNDLPSDVTGIRYVDCASTDPGSGSGTGNGSGSGTGSGTGDGAGSGSDSGTDDGSGTGAEAAAGDAGTADNAAGTGEVDPVTGLPVTGHGPGLATSLPAQLVILLMAATVAGIALRTGLRQRA
jgi:hypothetical protein